MPKAKRGMRYATIWIRGLATSVAPPISSSAAKATFESLLLAHLEKHKRYPPEARRRKLRGSAKAKPAALHLNTEKSRDKNIEVGTRGGIEDHKRIPGQLQKPLRNRLRTASAQFVEPNAPHVRGLDSAVGLFLGIRREVGTPIAERRVTCERRFGRRNQGIPLRNVMDIVDRVAATGLEVGNQQRGIEWAEHFGKRVCLQRKMPAQRGIGARDQGEGLNACCGSKVPRQLQRQRARLVRRKAA